MDFRELNEEVLVSKTPISAVTRADIEALKARALQNARRRIRLCAHQSVEDKVHEMLIVHTKNTYVRPHRHLGKSESFHIIEGELDVVMFREDGSVETVIEMGEINTNKRFYFRLSDSLYHTVVIRSDIAVFHETTNGPFHKIDTVFAPWSSQEPVPHRTE